MLDVLAVLDCACGMGEILVDLPLLLVSAVRTRILQGFEDLTVRPEGWDALLHTGDSDVVFLTWQWQRAWWETLGRGNLLLVAAERDGELVALAPLFSDAGMVYFVGADDADYLDFIGDTSDPEVLAALLQTARREVPDFLGFELEPILDASRTARRLAEAADRLGLACYDDWGVGTMAPVLDLFERPESAWAAAKKKSLLRHESALRREGPLQVLHLQDGKAILCHLDEFFEQHVGRWAETATPSFFRHPAVRGFYRRLTELAGDSGWLRFTRLDWNERAIAFHFGFCYRGSYLWYKPSFAIELARRSPGEVLLRCLLLAALEEGAHSFDFGLGCEPFKMRFATTANQVRKWGLYPQ